MSAIMQDRRTWLLIAALVVTIVLAIVGCFMYPVSDFGIFYAAGYVSLVALGALALLLLIFKKGLPMT